MSAYVVREICDNPSNFRMEDTLDTYLKEENVIGIYGVDTRQLTKILREEGTMNARVSKKRLTEEEVKAMAAYSIENAVVAVSENEKGFYQTKNAKYTLALWNFGVKQSTINNLLAQGCTVITMPATATAEEMLATGAHAIVLSDGAGNPAENTAIIEEIKKIVGKKPVLGLGLGHQLLALALGATTTKHKYGHRGGNQPVKCLADGKVYISTQNHGYDVVSSSVTAGKVSFINVNDNSCEGIEYENCNAISVQFVPEACNIGNEVNPVYNKFFAMIEKEKENA